MARELPNQSLYRAHSAPAKRLATAPPPAALRRCAQALDPVIRITVLAIGMAVSGIAYSQDEVAERRAAYRAAMEKEYELYLARPAKRQRIYETRPRRMDYPLRYLNIRDDEVAEIVVAAREVVPHAIVNISGVTTGCPCEEGPTCNAQVWIEAQGAGKGRGLQLSRLGRAWTIGAIQSWWLELEALQARRKSFASDHEYQEAEDGWVDLFPACVAQPTVPGGSPAKPATPEPQR